MNADDVTLEVALRVLTAVSDRHEPASKDMEDLAELAGPIPDGTRLDQFARGVIQDALKLRSQGKDMSLSR